MNVSPQDLLQLAPAVSDTSLIGYNRPSLSTSLVHSCYLMPSSGAPTLLAQRGALSTGLGGSSSQAWLQHLLSPWEFSTLDSPTCKKDDSSSLNHKRVLVMTYRSASKCCEDQLEFFEAPGSVPIRLFWRSLPSLNRLRAVQPRRCGAAALGMHNPSCMCFHSGSLNIFSHTLVKSTLSDAPCYIFGVFFFTK